MDGEEVHAVRKPIEDDGVPPVFRVELGQAALLQKLLRFRKRRLQANGEELKTAITDGMAAAPAEPAAAGAGTADELKKFKDLLDSGVITQEEFDAKKKELSGL